ncbi:hypothetical protein N9K35_04480 [Pseudomonadales bacterium]|nr:hypothetical protein [Pseudomonadales bacterium]
MAALLTLFLIFFEKAAGRLNFTLTHYYLLSGFFHGVASQGGTILLLWSQLRMFSRTDHVLNVSLNYLILCASQLLLVLISADEINISPGYILFSCLGFLSAALLNKTVSSKHIMYLYVLVLLSIIFIAMSKFLEGL